MTSMLDAGGPQTGQHGDNRAGAFEWGGLSPSRGPAGAPGAHGSVALRHLGSQATAASRVVSGPAEYEAQHYEQAAVA